MRRAWSVALFLLLVVGSRPVAASPIKWTLQDVMFGSDYCNFFDTWTCGSGGTAAGHFAFDASNNTVSDWDISVAGGNINRLPALEFNPSTSRAQSSSAAMVDFTGTFGSWDLGLAFVSGALNTPGTVPLDLTHHAGEFHFPDQGRRYVSGGELVSSEPSTVPEPSSILLPASGLATAVSARRKRQG